MYAVDPGALDEREHGRLPREESALMSGFLFDDKALEAAEMIVDDRGDFAARLFHPLGNMAEIGDEGN
ncbi:MAG TPA: hypothetical protein VFE77_05420 [Rhodanobacter sp.]|nr:hypothetical protein [Rhodanobacter sp.]